MERGIQHETTKGEALPREQESPEEHSGMNGSLY
jgi:hypothetical protein